MLRDLLAPGCRRREGKRRYRSREVRPGRRKGPYGTAFLLWMDHIIPVDPRGVAGVAGAGLSLAEPSQDPSSIIWGAEEMGSPEMRGPESGSVLPCAY